MALTQLISISGQASIIQQVLEDYAQPLGGVADVVSNLSDLWKQASISSSKPRILICYNGEKERGPFEIANTWQRVDRQWIVAVTRGRGYYSNRGDSLYVAGAQVPFYDVVEAVRDQIRTILNISEEQPTIDFKGIRPMQMGNLIIDGYLIEFSTANDLPLVLPVNENAPA